jgi:glycosyltransferase involved in cell wall biosynthesis
MAVSEAMAAGVPVIGSNQCGMPYMIEEGRSGFLIEPKDTGMIADRIARIMKSEGLRREMGHRGREIAMARFHPDAVAQKTVAVYESAIKAAGRVALQ